MGEPQHDTTYNVTVDRVHMSAASRSARNMIQSLENGAKAGGLDEIAIQWLVTQFIVIGQYTRGSGWAGPVIAFLTTQRPPRPLAAGEKHSTQLLFWVKKFEAAYDPKYRREALDKMQGLMFDLVWAFRLKLVQQDKARAAKFDAAMQKIAQLPWSTHYKFYH
jgi:hypothetical protein